jgi:putative sterol carrier protein
VILLDGSGAENLVGNADGEAACTIGVSGEDFAAVLDGRLNAMNAFMSGKFQVSGDLSAAMKLGKVLGG